MWRWVVWWQASTLLVVGATLDFRLFSPKQELGPSTLMNCFEYSLNTDKVGRTLDKGWRPQKKAMTTIYSATLAPTFPTYPMLNLNEISKRIDHLLPAGNDIVKEHAKLVQDINGLRQYVYVAPVIDDNRDYDDSIFHEIIETSTSTTTTPRPVKSKSQQQKASQASKPIPVILLGGAGNHRQVVKSQPLKFPKPTISLVGTSVSPLLKHPYPYVMQASSRKPVKVCMTALPMMYTTTTRRPSLWQRILSSLIPR